MKEFFIKIYAYIKVTIWIFIIRPLKKWYNLYINKCYIPDNERNQQILNYCTKILENENYQPSTPVENWIDNEWRENYKTLIKSLEGNNIPSYEECRTAIARKTLITLSEYKFIKER